MSALKRLTFSAGRAVRAPVQLAAASLAVVALVGAQASAIVAPASRSTSNHVRVTPTPTQPLRLALLRAGLTGEDAEAAADALSDQIDPQRPASGLSLDLRTERSPGGHGLRLIDLAASRQGRLIATLTRAADGGLRFNPGAPSASGDAVGRQVLSVVQGPMENVLYGAADQTRLALVAEATRLFARKLDLTRDLALGDRVSLVFAQSVDGAGGQGGGRRLLYAAIDTSHGAAAFYAHRVAASGTDEFVDADGETNAGALLRTPLAVARLTSSFGMRLHPLMGYSRMHEGVDFGAPVGAPVLAASDGVVEEARWAGGYGRWIKLRHSPGLETGYGHLSAWAAGLHAGEAVHQGEVIGYVGSTGLSTGPHLHFEVIDHGAPVDPAHFRPETRGYLTGADLAQFELEKQVVDAAVAEPRAGAAVVAER